MQQFDASWIQRSSFDRRADGAIRFAQMAAIAKLALPAERSHFNEPMFDLIGGQMRQTEFLQAGAVNQGCVRPQSIQARIGRRVTAGIEEG